MAFLKLKTKIRRSLNRFFKTNRPSNYPFMSGDSFRALAQHICDEHFDFDPENVGQNDIVYVRGNFLSDFFKTIHPKIKNKYILISHNEDKGVDESYAKFLLDEKIIHWFAENLLFNHPKITPIPIGLYNFHYYTDKLSCYDQKNIKKEGKISIMYGFTVGNLERISAEKNLDKSKIAQKINSKNREEYLEIIKKSYYVASPAGSGIDCHRTWEAVYLKTIPILLKNPMSEYFKNIGLPILLINSWDDIGNLTEEFLEKEYKKIYQTDNFPQIFMDYWQKEIIKYKKYNG